MGPLIKEQLRKLKLTNDGYPLDVFWDDLCEQYPYFFSSDTVSSEERLNRLLEVREELMPIEESYFEGDAANRAQLALTNEIINGFFRVPEATEKGKKYVFYDKRASDYEKSMEKMRETQLFVFW